MLRARSSSIEQVVACTVLLIPVLIVPIALRAAVVSWKNNSNDLITWADDDLPTKQEFQTFMTKFGRPELVVVSWPGCKSNSPELTAFADELAELSAGTENWFHHIATPNDVLEELANVRGFSKTRLKKQLRGILLGPNGEQACLVAELDSTGRAQRPTAIRKLKEAARKSGIPEDRLRVGGIGAQLAWVDHDSVAGPANLLPAMGVIVLCLCVLLVRSLPVGIFVSLLGAFTGIFSAALIHWCGVQSNAVLATLPTLGGLLTISLSLHFFGYFRQATKQSTANALQTAFQWAWKPTLISAATTALGLGSLLLSRTETIRQFGMFGAMITISAALFVLILMPAFLYLVGTNRLRPERAVSNRARKRWILFIQARSGTIVGTVALIAIIVGAGLANLHTRVDVNNMFVDGHEILRSDQWLESNIGPLSSLEVILAVPKEQFDNHGESIVSPVSHCLDPLQSLVDHLRETDDFNVVVSAVTGVPSVREMRGVRGVSARFHLRRWFDQQRDKIASAGMYAESETEHLWRLSVRIPAMSTIATSERSARLQQELQRFKDAYLDRSSASDPRQPATSGLRIQVTGLPLLFEQIEKQFIQDLLVTYLGGLFLITLAVFLVLRRISDALVAMIPNILPAIGVLGLLSLLSVELDVGSVMTASIALGVAVDDTLHFILWFQKERRSGSNTSNAVRSAIDHCGAPILQTSIVCGIGLSILGFAPFLPTVRFGTLIAGMLGVALIGDLLFLPSVLLLRGRRESIAPATPHT